MACLHARIQRICIENFVVDAVTAKSTSYSFPVDVIVIHNQNTDFLEFSGRLS
jgi:hypothetical protein